MRRGNADWLQVVTHVAALTILAVLTWMLWQERLGPAPVQAVTRLLGRYALVLLLLSLVPTVIRTVTGWGAVMRLRRTLGLYAFLYAVLHFLAFAGFDYGFEWGLIATTIRQSRREIVGALALVILGLLALTSIGSLMKRLGKAWKWLHRLVYAAGGLVVVHYMWNYKELRTGPALAGAAIGLLLLARVPPVTGFLSRWRSQRSS